MIPSIAKFIEKSFRSRSKSPKTATLKDLQSIRSALSGCVEDCQGLSTQKLQLKITSAATPQDLWMLRNDAYSVISQQHNQSVATDRINKVMKVFDGWVDRRQLVRIK